MCSLQKGVSTGKEHPLGPEKPEILRFLWYSVGEGGFAP